MPETEITSTVDNDSLRESIHAEEGGREEGRRRRAAPSETGAAHSLVVFVCCPYSSKHLRSGSCVCPTRRRFLGRWRCSPLRLGVPPTHIRRRRGGHVSSSLDTAESPFAGSEGETIISRKGEASAPAPPRALAAHLRSDDGSSGDKSLGSCRRLLPSLSLSR